MRWLALALAGAMLLGCGAEPTPEDRLPDVVLPSLVGGSSVDLGSFTGPAVVNLWAQWCTPCRRELPIYQRFAERHAGSVKVLGVDWQDPQTERAQAMLKEAGVTYPVVVDSEPVLQARGLPRLLLIDADGTIAHSEYREIEDLAELEDLVEAHLGGLDE